jgi:release factor family 7
MDILNPTDIKSLIAQQGKWCISLYIPTHRVGREQQQDPIRLRNLLAEAETKLLTNGLRRPQVEELMRPAEELLWRDNFWRHLSDGLAIFLSNDLSVIYRLPVEFEELLVIANSFHIKPLLPLLGRVGKFYILGLSLNNIRLFQGTPDTMSEIALNFPTGMDEALWMDEPERYLNLHSSSVSTRQAGIFHGHGIDEDEKKNILRFFYTVNERLNALIEDKTVSMILAGVDYLLPIYREASTYPNVLKDGVTGNPDRENLNELHQRAWNIVKPLFEESQKKAFEKYRQLSGQQSAQTTNDLSTAVKAAKFGQVETLFVPLGVQLWGRYDEANNKVILDSRPDPENEDLLDFAAAETILNSGQVFAVAREQIPGGSNLAAILRYPMQSP